ncbi:MAG: hypothetical protein H6925_04740 [Holosporaceae bacterium]|nr:MAG: hypothetical protein H6925_04740 [Holosporaceae bacterium]
MAKALPGTHAQNTRLSLTGSRPGGAWSAPVAQTVRYNRMGWGDAPPPIKSPLFPPASHPSMMHTHRPLGMHPGTLPGMAPPAVAPPMDHGGCSFSPARLVEIWHRPQPAS